MQRDIRLGLALFAALAFTPAFARASPIGGDNTTEHIQSLTEEQAQAPREAVSARMHSFGGDNSDEPIQSLTEEQEQVQAQMESPDQNEKSDRAGAASGEPDQYNMGGESGRYDLQDRWYQREHR